MKNILTDIKTTAALFREVWKARGSGSRIQIQHVKDCPVLTACGILNTVEGCTLINGNKEIFYAAQKVFNDLPYEEQHRLTFSPKNGEFTARVQFWKALLMPVMSDKQFHTGMQTIIRWYIHIKRGGLYEG